MNIESKYNKVRDYPPIYIVSGGSGASGELLAETVLAQFPDVQIPIVLKAYIQRAEHIKTIVAEALKTKGIIIHTFVSKELRKNLIRTCKSNNVATFDLMGPLFDHLSKIVGQKPVEQPGLYRKQRKNYFDRVDAIEFTIKHDDGKKVKDLEMADLVITGVSRTGKTPLSMYLAVMGWKVANVPIMKDAPVPMELSEIDRYRVFALDIDYEQLVEYRRQRQARMGIPSSSVYTTPRAVYDELEFAADIFKRHRFTIITVTNKPIESSASEIIEIITRRFKGDSM